MALLRIVPKALSVGSVFLVRYLRRTVRRDLDGTAFGLTSSGVISGNTSLGLFQGDLWNRPCPVRVRFLESVEPRPLSPARFPVWLISGATLRSVFRAYLWCDFRYRS